MPSKLLAKNRFVLALASASLVIGIIAAKKSIAETLAGKPNSDKVVGYIVSVRGQVQINRNNQIYPNVKPNTILYSGDLLLPSGNTRVEIICLNGDRHPLPRGVPSGANNFCSERDEPILSPDGLFGPTRQPRGNSPAIANSPYIISPRATTVLADKPTLRWNSVPGATSYKVSIEGEGVKWLAETKSNAITYDGNEPLKPGFEYQINIAAAGNQATAKATFRLLDEQQKQSIINRAKEYAKLDWSEETKAIITARFYNTYGLIADAIEGLESLPPANNPAVYSKLGNLYLQIELYSQAESNYLKAAQLAASQGEQLQQFTAQEGLIQLAYIYISQQQLLAAENLLAIQLEKPANDWLKYYRWMYLGWIYLEQGKYDQAKNNLQQAIDLQPNLPPAYCVLKEVLEAQKDKAGAEAAKQKCSN